MNFTSYLHSLHTLQEGKNKQLTRGLKKKQTKFLERAVFILLVIASLHSCQKNLYMTVGSKNVLQLSGQMNNLDTMLMA